MKKWVLLFVMTAVLLSSILPVSAAGELLRNSENQGSEEKTEDRSGWVTVPGFDNRQPIWPSVTGGNQQKEPSGNSAPDPTKAPSGGLWADTNTKTQDVMTQTATPAPAPSSSSEEPIWSNFNNDPVSSGPEKYRVLTVKKDADPVLVQRVRTHHWNNGKGAEPGTISVYEDGVKIATWPAIGRSAYGVPNVYWEALVDFITYPGHEYYFAVSDADSLSYNEATGYTGMFEIYGIDPAPEGYIPSTKGNVSGQNSGTSSIPSSVRAGETFKMGRYEQDNNKNNGPEAIEWQVLTVQNDRVLVISRYILDEIKWTENNGITDITALYGKWDEWNQTHPMTWENSLYRKWLNGDFYNTAFTDEEKSRILLVTNETPDNPVYGTKGGNRTQDRIFLLSLDEAERYFRNDDDRMSKPTKLAVANGAIENDYFGGTADWGLRSPGFLNGDNAFVNSRGALMNGNANAPLDQVYHGMRPAFWMKTAPAPAPTAAPRNCHTVKYIGNDCLAVVPTDQKCYQSGETVTVLFEPVEYMQSKIFNGWDMNGDGVADYGYYYNTFPMPNTDVELIAICYNAYQQDHGYYQYNQNGVTTGPVDPQYNNNSYINNDIYDPNTGWWFDPADYYNYYYNGVG